MHNNFGVRRSAQHRVVTGLIGWIKYLETESPQSALGESQTELGVGHARRRVRCLDEGSPMSGKLHIRESSTIPRLGYAMSSIAPDSRHDGSGAVCAERNTEVARADQHQVESFSSCSMSYCSH